MNYLRGKMGKFFCRGSIYVLVFTSITSLAVNENSEIAHTQKFEMFMKQYSKKYLNDDEYVTRNIIFQQNLKLYSMRNSIEMINGGTNIHGMNIYSFSTLDFINFLSRNKSLFRSL